MKNAFFVCLISLLFIKTATAQDMLIKNNGDTIRAKITEITDESVRYKKTNNPDGPTFVTNKSELLKLIYANGTEEIVVAPPPAEKKIEEVNPRPAEPNIDTRGDGKTKSSSTGFEQIAIESFGYYYKGMRMNEARLNYHFKQFGDPTILKEFKSAKTNHTASTITGLVSIPFAVGGVMFAIISVIPNFEYNDNTGENEITHPYSNLLGPGIALFAGFIGLEVTSIVLKSTYKTKLKKTVQHYNSVIAQHDLK